MWTVETTLPITIAIIQVQDLGVDTEKKAFDQLTQCAHEYYRKYKESAIGQIAGIQAARRLFHAIGVDPTKHRPSSEALLNRAIKNKPLYAVNSLVDVGNWCSLDFLLPICIYDCAKIVGNVTIRTGRDNESYQGLNNRILNLQGRYVIADALGPFGSPMTDSQRTVVTSTTRYAVSGIFAPKDYDPTLLQQQAHLFARRTLDLCGGSLVGVDIL